MSREKPPILDKPQLLVEPNPDPPPLPVDKKTKYDPRFPAMARAACERMGATDGDLAALFDVDIYTIHRWKTRHEEFGEALILGKDVANKRVERALYTRAVGYEYTSEKLFYDKSTKTVVRAEITVHIPPDTWACNTWLMNRDPDRWRHKFELSNVKPAEVTDQPLTADEWDKKYAFGPDRTN